MLLRFPLLLLKTNKNTNQLTKFLSSIGPKATMYIWKLTFKGGPAKKIKKKLYKP